MTEPADPERGSIHELRCALDSQRRRMVMRKIYVSDSGNDNDDGLTEKTPIRSWQRFIQLCEGNDEIIILGNADTGKMKLIAEIDKKSRVAKLEIVPKAS
jgi:hypothetical protein